MKVIKRYEPIPMNGAQSFGGKCRIMETDDGSTYLRSYSTIVGYEDNKGDFHRTWDGWTKATGTHLQVLGIVGKVMYLWYPLEELPEGYPEA